jgi:hypothetical protein
VVDDRNGQMMTEGPAIECGECSTITIGDDPNMACPPCEEAGRDPYCTTPVTLSLCPVEPGGECTDDAHHWGISMHVVER